MKRPLPNHDCTRWSRNGADKLANRQGIFYFLSHRSLWKPFTSKLGQLITVSAGVIGGMFAFTYLPQLAVLVFTSGPFAVVSTVILVLNESSTIINLLSRSWILQDAILDTFDGTLISRNATNMVREGREVKSGSDPIARLGKTLKSPFTKFSPTALIRYVMYLPLNFIPVFGTAAFMYLQGISGFQKKETSMTRTDPRLARNRGTNVHGRVRLPAFAGPSAKDTNNVGAVLSIEKVDCCTEARMAREPYWCLYSVCFAPLSNRACLVVIGLTTMMLDLASLPLYWK